VAIAWTAWRDGHSFPLTYRSTDARLYGVLASMRAKLSPEASFVLRSSVNSRSRASDMCSLLPTTTAGGWWMMTGMEDGAPSLPTTLPPTEFLVLGRVEARRAGRELPLGRRRERSLLAVLLLAAGQVVPTERLVDLLWDGAPPATARAGLHTHVSRLRARLPGVEVSARDGGYCAEVDPDTVDAHRFVRLVAAAREVADPARRAAELRAALTLWRGEAMADTATDLLRARVTAELTELRFTATELAVEADLACGRHADVIGELTTLTAEYPLREELWAHLLVALYRAGRQAEALDAYARARRCLADELGIEPGPRLRQLHQDILTAKAEPGDTATAHHQLPRDITEFTGRDAELSTLHSLVAAARDTAVTIIAIEGMGGVGKTRLAIRAAHQLADRFADLQLWLDLRGFDPDRHPVPASAALDTFLRLLGVPDQHIPPDEEERAALYRDRLTGRRALVVLDNVADERQVRPLLPASPQCLVLITSRRMLSGLDGVHSLPLNAFTADESVELLSRVVGADRVSAEIPAARRIADLCGHLPIAIGLAARRLRARPTWRLADLAAKLEHARPDLDTIFDLSYDGLPPRDRRLFRLLGLHPGDDVTPASAAALADVPLAEADAGLELLLDEHLLDQVAPNRYRLHDFLRAYAKDRARDDDRDAAVGRVVTHYLTTAQQATKLLRPTETRRVPTPSADTALATKADAIAWAAAEHANLMAAARAAADLPDRSLVVDLVLALYWPLANRGLSSDRIALNELAVRTARELGDRRGEAQALEDLGTIWGQVGRFEESVAHNRRALALWRTLGDPMGEQGCLAGLGMTYQQHGKLDEALSCLDEALDIDRRNGFRIGEASVLNYLGLVHQAMKEHDAAVEFHRESAATHHALGNVFGEAVALANLSWAQQRAGHPREAIPTHTRSLALFTTIGDRYNEAEQHWGLGEAHRTLGHAEDARTHHHRAIDILQDINLLSPTDADALRRDPAPPTPEIIRLNT
jgi:DNA-binding SARP family transcriptional activator/tetratricopeptide (TPR) repeat protein